LPALKKKKKGKNKKERTQENEIDILLFNTVYRSW